MESHPIFRAATDNNTGCMTNPRTTDDVNINADFSSVSWGSSWNKWNETLSSGICASIVCILPVVLVVMEIFHKKSKLKKVNYNEVQSKISFDPTISHECIQRSEFQRQQQERKRKFLQRAGDDYGYSSSPAGFIDTWRQKEFPSLIAPVHLNENQDETNIQQTNNPDEEVYLDYAGAAIASRSLLNEIHEQSLSSSSILANPHSSGPAAARTLRLMEQAKKEILDHFNAQPGRFASIANNCTFSSNDASSLPSKNGERNAYDWFHPGYEIIFTSGTTEALRIVAEHFPWSNGANGSKKSLLLYPHNAHTSVVGMRGSVLAQGASFLCKNLDEIMELADDQCCVEDTLNCWRARSHSEDTDTTSDDPSNTTIRNLLVLPAECNFGGARPNATKLMRRLRNIPNWSTMLDLAKAASTSPINLRELDPDFACVSFYKIFGVPTGLGALFVRRTASSLLLNSNTNLIEKDIHEKSPSTIHRYFGGGSVDVVLSRVDFAVGRNLGHSSSLSSRNNSPSSLASLIHGTVHFRGISSLPLGFRELDRLGGMGKIRLHTNALAMELTRRLKSLRHGNQCPVVKVYGAWSKSEANVDSAGPVVAFNVVRMNGEVVGYNEVEKLAALNKPPLQLRTGCFCNPGACQEALRLSDKEILANYTTSGHVCGDEVDIISGKPTGAIRASFGKDSLWEDLDALVVFIETHFLTTNITQEVLAVTQNVPAKAALSELFIYPIKSCVAQRVKRWKMSLPSGRLQYDREFALVDSFGRALRLQKYPMMAFIRPSVDPERGTLRVSAPNMHDLVLNLNTEESNQMYMSSVVNVCGNRCSGKLWGDVDGSEWFSSFLGVQCWLARYDGGGYYNRNKGTLGSIPRSPCPMSTIHAFSNEKPLLLISKESVEKLNSILRRRNQPTVSARNFRPNLVVDCNDAGAWHPEDSWESIEVEENGVELNVCGLCARCSMVDVDATTGTKGKTLQALSEYRRSKSGGTIHFGIFLDGSASSKEIKDTWVEEGMVLICR